MTYEDRVRRPLPVTLSAEMGRDYARCAGVMVVGHDDLISELCKQLVAAGYDPATHLEVYCGNMLALTVRSIQKGTKQMKSDLDGSGSTLSVRTLQAPWWHGGAPGRQVGDWLLPPLVTGHQHIWPDATPTSPHHVYVTTMLPFAAAHATLYAARKHPEESRVYRVTPAQPLQPDPEALMDCPAAATWSYRCPRAQVDEVLDLTWDGLVALTHDPDFLAAFGIPPTRYTAQSE